MSGIPDYYVLIESTFKALKILGDSGRNQEINEAAIQILDLPAAVLDIPHVNSNLSEIEYRLAWARTILKKYGAIINSSRGVWSITSDFLGTEVLDGELVNNTVNEKYYYNNSSSNTKKGKIQPLSLEKENDDIPDEIRPWRIRLHAILTNMDPFAFERLAQNLLRECGFTEVRVTKKTGDGGIDGFGKLRINGIFSFNVAFQCKRYSTPVSAGDIRDFRGSLTTSIEKGIFITTSSFSRDAIKEASSEGKQQIDLINGEDLLRIISDNQIGVREVKDYEIDEEYFKKI